jgi:polysaccharide biosynthesis transport protein
MLGNFDIKYAWAVFKRRLPYFLVITTIFAAIAITIAYILPPVYQSSASLLVEPQQISDAEATGQVDPYEQIQIIEQRLMTRANLYDMAQRIGLYADQTDLSAGEIIADMKTRIEFVGFEPDPTTKPGTPGATIIGVNFFAPAPPLATKGANELVSLILEENTRMRADRASDTLDFFKGEVERLTGEIQAQSKKIADFKTANIEALPDSQDSRRAQQERGQARLLDLDREEASLKSQRASIVWVFERTGRASANVALSPEEQELQTLQSQLLQQQAIYKPTSPQIRVLQTRIAALQQLVQQQQANRAVPSADGSGAGKPLSELDVELAPIDQRLADIAAERGSLQTQLADLDAAQQATPNNEMVLNDLERQLASLQTQYTNAVNSLGQAQQGEKIEVMSKGQRFTLIEAPFDRNVPVSPQRLLISAAGLMGGLGAALAFVVLWEMLNRSIRRPVELSQHLGIQPIVTIPYIRTTGEQRLRRMLLLGAILFIIVVVPMILLLVHTQYEPLDQLIPGLG